MVRIISSVIVAVMLLAWGGSSYAQEGEGPAEAGALEYFFDHVHISLEGGSSPFLGIQYAVRFVDDQAIVVQTKQYAHVPVYDNRIAVVKPEEATALMKKIGEEGVLDLSDAGEDAPFA